MSRHRTPGKQAPRKQRARGGGYPGFELPPNLPPPGFDPVGNANDSAKLDYYWLPARPDPRAQPQLYEHWAEMFATPVTHVHPEPYQDGRPLITKPSGHSIKRLRRRSKFQQSRNWSGAYINAMDAKPFKRVVGRWTVPTLAVTEIASGAANSRYCCSIWIGVDGKYRWTGSLPQVGSEHRLSRDGKTQTDRLLFEWWVKGAPADPQTPYAPYFLTHPKIQPGDVVMCSLTVDLEHTATVHLLNRTSGEFATARFARDKVIFGSTAEWIVERPSDPLSVIADGEEPLLYPFPDFGQVTLDMCAVEQDMPVEDPFWLPKLIQLKETFTNPTRTMVVSQPALGAEPRSVQLTYRSP
jgi:peptidase A4-like protein